MQSFYSKLKSVFKSDGSESNCCAWATLKKIAVPAGVWEKNCTLGFLLLGFQIATFPHSSRQCFLLRWQATKRCNLLPAYELFCFYWVGPREKTTQKFMGNLQYFSSYFRAQFLTITSLISGFFLMLKFMQCKQKHKSNESTKKAIKSAK